MPKSIVKSIPNDLLYCNTILPILLWLQHFMAPIIIPLKMYNKPKYIIQAKKSNKPFPI